MSSANLPLIEGEVEKSPNENKHVKLRSRLPAEIDKKSVVRYLRKDVAKTKLYRSLPLYLLFLAVCSIALILQKDDAPTGYWLNSASKSSITGTVDNSQVSVYESIQDVQGFYDWITKELTSPYVGGSTSESVTEYLVLRQYRGKVDDCSGDTQLSVLAPHARRKFTGLCQIGYADDNANTASYGPANRFVANKNTLLPFSAPPFQGAAHTYADSGNSFSLKIPSRSDPSSLVYYLQSTVNATLNQQICTSISTEEDCLQNPVCGWLGICVTKKLECTRQMSLENCTASSCSWDDETASCYVECGSLSQEACLTCEGCTSNGTCFDPRPDGMRTLDIIKSSSWIDASTRALSVDLLEYNTHSSYFVFTSYFIEILPVGGWLPQVKSYPFHIFGLYSPLMKAMFAADVLTTVYIAWSVISVLLQIRHNADVGKVSTAVTKDTEIKKEPEEDKKKGFLNTARRYLNGVTFTVIYGIAFCVVFLVALGFKWQLWSFGISLLDTDVDSLSNEVADYQVWNDLVKYMNIFKEEKLIYATAVILSWLRLFEYVQYNERLNSLTETIRIATSSLIGLSIIFGIIFVGFVFAGNLVYGSDLGDFSTLLRTAGFMMRLLFSAELDDYDKFRSIESGWSVVYFGLFFALAWLVLLNMVLAIITSSFNIVKQNTARGKAPSWAVPALMTDIKKFLNRLTTRTQPFAFSTRSAKKRKKAENEDGGLDSLVGGNYVVDRVKAIRILEEPSSDNLQRTSSEDSAEAEKKDYITFPVLNARLSHMHPNENRRIFAKSSNESVGNRQLRQSERFAEFMAIKFEHVEKALSKLAEQVSEQERHIKQNSSDIASMTTDAKIVRDEIGTGKVDAIHQTVDNIDNNVYLAPRQIALDFRQTLRKKLTKLQTNVNEPMDQIIEDMELLLDQVSSPTLLGSPRRRLTTKGSLIQLKPEKVAILSSPKLGSVGRNPIVSEFSPRSAPTSPPSSPERITLVEGTVAIPILSDNSEERPTKKKNMVRDSE
eukprot:TRINITY_DN178_c4_g1_i1.p1 TRINITY_DN178_c4_g1~~TRINITY_DN178_c4_g1_i1.p1  ORF type:complete len:1005 (+),score=134.67 TRINITY_DN178_c4_g1_i1:112-3126(+)